MLQQEEETGSAREPLCFLGFQQVPERLDSGPSHSALPSCRRDSNLRAETIPWGPLVLPSEKPASLLPAGPDVLETSQPCSYPAEADRQRGLPPPPLAKPLLCEQCPAVSRQWSSMDPSPTVD